MTPKQHKLYIGTWLRVKKTLITLGGFSKEEAEAKRHEIHTEALGKDKSSKEFTNADLDRVLDAFQVYLGLSDPRQSKRAVEQPRKRALHAIHALGHTDAYIAAICQDRFGHTNLDALSESDLWKLKITLVERARAKARKQPATTA